MSVQIWGLSLCILVGINRSMEGATGQGHLSGYSRVFQLGESTRKTLWAEGHLGSTPSR